MGKFHYSSLFIKEKIESFSDLLQKVPPNNTVLILDTNICVYLRDFCREPAKFLSSNDKKEIWESMKSFLYNVEHYDIDVNYSLGIEESCRNLNDFSVNFNKLREAVFYIDKIFSMSYDEVLQHSQLLLFQEPVKDMTKKTDSKLQCLDRESSYQNLVLLSYCSLLKLICLDMDSKPVSREDLFYEYLNFLAEDMDVIGGTSLAFGFYYFGNNRCIKNMIIKKNKAKDFEGFLHNIWNCAIDLAMPTLVNTYFRASDTIPVFVTCDEGLALMFNSLKVRMAFTNGSKIMNEAPPMIEIDLSSETEWSRDEIIDLNRFISQIQQKRILKNLPGQKNINYTLSNMKKNCRDLEYEAKKIFECKKPN